MGTRKILYWLARPYEGEAWKRSEVPPSDETRRYCEFMPVYEDMAYVESVVIDPLSERFKDDFASIFGGEA